MALAYKSSASNANGAITLPTVASGDLMIVFAYDNVGEGPAPIAQATTPSGWTRVGSTAVYWKISNGTESGTSPNFGGSSDPFIGCMVFTGSATVNPISVTETTTASANLSVGAASSVALNSMAVFARATSFVATCASYAGGSLSWTEAYDASSATTNDSSLSAAYAPMTSIASVTATATISSGAASSILNLVFIKEPQDISVAETVTLSETNAFVKMISVIETITLTEVSSIKSGFMNLAKSVASWFNSPKS